jgi:hypothetical protein
MATRKTTCAASAILAQAASRPLDGFCLFEPRQNPANPSRLFMAIAAISTAALTAWAGQALALEGPTPYLPGATVGVPTGALPPPGFYANDLNTVLEGGLKDNNGNDLHANASVYLNVPSILWVPTYQPFQFLGASYAAALVQPYVQQNLDLSGIGAGKSVSQGIFNTIVSPLNLSWNLNPFFIKTGLGIYLKDGFYQTNTLASGAKVTSSAAIANNFWTFEPDLALSWLQGGWDLTLHGVIDTNTKNTTTNYQSGDVFYLDFTAGKSIGKWTVGVGGNFSQQFTDDVARGASVNGNGHRFQQVLLGPYAGYDFGPASVNAKVLQSVHAENGFSTSQYDLSVSFPF